jgi:hypothetical protein
MDMNKSRTIQSEQNSDIIGYVFSALAGFGVCFGITVVTGSKEAWDNGAYFSIGIPIMCLLIFGIGYKFPVKPWRWAAAQAVGQSIAISLAGNSLNLWPLSIMAMSILSMPQLGAAYIGAKLGQSKAQPNRVR